MPLVAVETLAPPAPALGATELHVSDTSRDGTDAVAAAAYQKMLTRLPTQKPERDGTVLRIPLAV